VLTLLPQFFKHSSQHSRREVVTDADAGELASVAYFTVAAYLFLTWKRRSSVVDWLVAHFDSSTFTIGTKSNRLLSSIAIPQPLRRQHSSMAL
jgi:hypothetical protein